jgi:acetolactate synthase-1/2/3 large subunit
MNDKNLIPFNERTESEARELGAKGGRADSPEKLRQLAEEAFSYNGTFVIDCAVDCREAVLPMLIAEDGISDIITEIK